MSTASSNNSSCIPSRSGQALMDDLLMGAHVRCNDPTARRVTVRRDTPISTEKRDEIRRTLARFELEMDE